MTTPLTGALVTAGILGVTHAIEPDHVAGISTLTSRYGDARLSALVGACFSFGHVSLVVAWLAVGYGILERTSFPPVYDAVGTVGVGVVLGLLGTTMAVGGLRTLVHAHEHAHGDETHSHVHFHVPIVGANAHDHDHGVVAYLKTGLVGALFTLSPPLSMIAFSAALFPTYGPATVALAVVVYAAGITATMSAVGAGVGKLFDLTAGSTRAQGLARVVAGVLVGALAVSLLVGSLPVFV